MFVVHDDIMTLAGTNCDVLFPLAQQAGSMLFAPNLVHRVLRRELDLSTWIMMGYALRSVQVDGQILQNEASLD